MGPTPGRVSRICHVERREIYVSYTMEKTGQFVIIVDKKDSYGLVNGKIQNVGH